MAKGKLICLESIDGGGKSTQVKIISDFFKEKNLSYAHFHFPMYGHNQFSDIIARFLRGEFGAADEVDPLFVANMYAMDRFRFLPALEKALNENDVVLLDRYVYSNIAYQCAKMEGPEEMNRMKEWIFDFEFNFLNLPYPDLNIFLDVPTEVTRQRLESQRNGSDREYLQGKQDVHEADMNFQEIVRKNYITFMEGAVNCKIVSCAYSLGEDDNRQWLVLKPNDLFDTYKKYLDYVIFNVAL